MKEEALRLAVKEWKEAFEERAKGPIKIIAPSTSEGITAAAILTRILQRKQKDLVITFSDINEKVIEELSFDTVQTFILLDEGETSLSVLEAKLKQKEVFLISSHRRTFASPSLHLLSPIEEQIQSMALLSYLFALEMSLENKDLAKIVVPLVFDQQDKIAAQVIEEAKQEHLQKEGQGFLFLHSPLQLLPQALAEVTSPFFPGISGSERGAVSFLENLAGEWKTKQGWKRSVDLNEEECRILTAALIKRKWEAAPLNLEQFGEIWTMKVESEPIAIQEWAEIVKVCGIVKQPITGLRICLGKKLWLTQGRILKKKYNQELGSVLELFYQQSEKKELKVIDQILIWVCKEQFSEIALTEAVQSLKKNAALQKYVVFGILGSTKTGDHFLYMTTIHPTAQFDVLINGLSEAFPLMKKQEGEKAWYTFSQAKEEEILNVLASQSSSIRVEEHIQE
ncbi:hypothetical protein HZB00_03925 [Candidatus Woesearchaeota archaeon]|nr:hypothetical protein [Candidatus Woesearchaeota archaeon]